MTDIAPHILPQPVNAYVLVCEALASAMAPDPDVKPVEWACNNLIVADGPYAGAKWSYDLTPYAGEILDNLSPASPHTRISVRKSAQTGLTGVGTAWICSVIVCAPASCLIVFPTIAAGDDYNAQKLIPTIEQTPDLKYKVYDHGTRSKSKSTKRNKKFAGGSLVLTGANSASDLRSKTVKYAFCDEVDEWPFDLDGQGDPDKMVDARQIAFHASGDYKKFECSTPTIKGQSRIDNKFLAGDQRYYHVPCPHCDEYQRLIFQNLRFNKTYPYNAHYVCEKNGCIINHHEKRAMVRQGKWIADKAEIGRHPSYHIDALISNLTTWDHIAAEWWAAQDDAQKLKAFVNLWLGESWDEKGDAPDYQRLMGLRDSYTPYHVPYGGVILTCAVDVQADGLYFETVAWGADKQSWSIAIGFLSGDTTDAYGGAWLKLDKLASQLYQFSNGLTYPCDIMFIDSGYNANAVYNFTRTHAKCYAIKGAAGWHLPALSSSPTKVDLTAGGKKLKKGAQLWHVGTYSLKSELYANLHKKHAKEGCDSLNGLCHFTDQQHDEGYFKQLCAEYIKPRENKGYTIHEWHARGPNHYHDCRIYNMAAAHKMGVGIMPPSLWAKWASVRMDPTDATETPDLFLQPDAGEEEKKEVKDIKESEVTTNTKPQRRTLRRTGRRGGFVGGWKN